MKLFLFKYCMKINHLDREEDSRERNNYSMNTILKLGAATKRAVVSKD